MLPLGESAALSSLLWDGKESDFPACGAESRSPQGGDVGTAPQ